jgi:DNA-binding transcriptional ArsR family regulator
MEHLSKLAGAEIAEKEREDSKFFYYRGSGWPEN